MIRGMWARVLAVAIALAPASNLAGCESAPPGTEGSPAPSFEAASLDGGDVALTDFREDRVVLLNIWATWCPPCREEMPDLQQLHEEYQDDGLQVVGVSIDGRGSDEGVRHFLEEHGVEFMILRDPSDEVSRAFGARGVPATYLVDREGTIQWHHMGPVTADDPGLRGALDETLSTS